MANILYIYTGPLLIVPTIKEPGTRQIKGCLEHGEMNSDFCPHCGKKTTFWRDKTMYHLDWAGILDENLCYEPRGYKAYFYPNHHGFNYTNQRDESEIQEIDSEEITLSLDKFEDKYKNEIKIIRDKVDHPGKIIFGTFAYWM